MRKTGIKLLLLLQVSTGMAQTRMTDINTNGGSNPGQLSAVGNQLFFTATESNFGTEPYVMDSLGNVLLVKDIRPSGGSGAFAYTEMNNAVYFLASPINGSTDLYKYESGTTVKINGTGSGIENSYQPNEDKITVYLNKLIFAYNDNSFNFGEELYQYNGIANSISLLRNINTGFFGSSPRDFITMNNVLYFTAISQTHGLELWRYNGSSVARISDLAPNSANGLPLNSGIQTQRFVVFQNELYFAGSSGSNGLFELYKYSGTGFPQVIPINQKRFKQIHSFHVVNNTLVFTGLDSVFNQKLYQYDGSNPIQAISDTIIGTSVSFNGKLLFGNDDGINGYELWEFDGIGKPKMVADINPGSNSSMHHTFFTIKERYGILGNKFYFTANDGTNGFELYEYDGVSTPTFVSDINPGQADSYPYSFEVFNDILYFAADDGVHGTEIWSYNPLQVALKEEAITHIKFYPNPAQNFIQLESNQQIDEIEIIDVLGRSMLRIEKPSNHINVSQLNNGSYYMQIRANGRQTTRPLMISK